MKIDFIKNSKYFIILSLIACIVSISSILINKIDMGLEFTGGIEIELYVKNRNILKKITNELAEINDIKIENYYNNNIKIKIKKKNIDKAKQNIETILENKKKYIELISTDYIGSEISDDTIKNTIVATILAVISMIVYLSIRFQYKFAIGATITLLHDMILILGMISIMKIEFTIAALAAIFTVFGYSINDTVVIFDRVRENIKFKKKIDYIIINNSINSTLSRTLITSISTLITIIILIIICGKILFEFSIILLAGIIIGTYSSIYISTILTVNLSNYINNIKFNSKINNYFEKIKRKVRTPK